MKKIPFDFVLDELFSLNPLVKPMFGCHAVYVGEKIFLILRDKKNHTDANGIWIATSTEHHQSLKKEIPSLHSECILVALKKEVYHDYTIAIKINRYNHFHEN